MFNTRNQDHRQREPMRILTIFTGGTIGSEESNDGFRPASPKKQADAVTCAVRGCFSGQVELVPIQPLNLLSETFYPTDWAILCEAILQNTDNVDGVLVLHGTDTLAYTATALSLFESASKRLPIVITGANRPLSVPGSDGPVNIGQSLAALEYLIQLKKLGVFVVFNGTNKPTEGGKIFLASRVMKQSWVSHCFRNFNLGERTWIGEVSGNGVVQMDDDVWTMIPQGIVIPNIQPVFDHPSVDFFKIAPGWKQKRFQQAIEDHEVKAIILALYNSGTGPTSGAGSLVEPLRRAKEKGTLIFAVSQHEGTGGMTMDSYETSQILSKEGVIPLKDMMWESAIPKLMLALGNHREGLGVKDFMLTNLTGEITT